MGKERDGSDNRVHGGETLGNSLGRAPVGRSDMEATRGDGGWEIACGESSGGKERCGSDGRVDRRDNSALAYICVVYSGYPRPGRRRSA